MSISLLTLLQFPQLPFPPLLGSFELGKSNIHFELTSVAQHSEKQPHAFSGFCLGAIFFDLPCELLLKFIQSLRIVAKNEAHDISTLRRTRVFSFQVEER